MKICDRCESRHDVQPRFLALSDDGPLILEDLRSGGMRKDLCKLCRDQTLKMLEDWFRPLPKAKNG